MRILVVSHTVFSNHESMGKTLSGFFHNWNADDIAQLYFHSQVPTVHVSENYYSITDKNILKSIVTRKSGTIYSKKDIQENRTDARTDTGVTAALYQKGRARTPLIFALRNTAWKLGKWDTPRLRAWLDEFAPEVVFFASGDYSFSYDIALKIAKTRKIPLVVSCMDDYYFYNHNQGKLFAGVSHWNFMRHVKKTMSYASAVTCICEKMTEDYEKLFGIPCYTLHTAASFEGPLKGEKKQQIVYMGNLGYDRDEQLVKIGKCLKHLNLPQGPDFLTVYSRDQNPDSQAKMTKENGIEFRGSISAEQVRKVMAESLAVVHTEAFDEANKNKVRYSVSTKIADSLMSGTCIFAFGPADIASVEYLMKNEAAVCAVSDDALKEQLSLLLEDKELRSRTEQNALWLAKKNHSRTTLKNILGSIFEKA